MTIQEKYKEKCNHPSDINELLPTLKAYADMCEHVTEMGVRTVVATYAFLASKAKQVVGIDIVKWEQVEPCAELCRKENRAWKFIKADVLKYEIEETDFLFIDTFHTYSQLSAELKLHAHKARKYLGFHDTTTYAHKGEDSYEAVSKSGMNCGRGLWKAIEEFLAANPEWVIDLKLENNNGLTILKRIS